jgi:choline dehydrogenase
MNYFVGTARDYDRWEQHYGAKEWSWKHVLPYFIKLENLTDLEILKLYPKNHGTAGEMTITTNKNLSDFENKWTEAVKNAGYKVIIDFNTDRVDKTHGKVQKTRRNGRRLTTSTAYLEPIASRQNLHILTNTYATKILFEDKNNCNSKYLESSKIFIYNFVLFFTLMTILCFDIND